MNFVCCKIQFWFLLNGYIKNCFFIIWLPFDVTLASTGFTWLWGRWPAEQLSKQVQYACIVKERESANTVDIFANYTTSISM